MKALSSASYLCKYDGDRSSVNMGNLQFRAHSPLRRRSFRSRSRRASHWELWLLIFSLPEVLHSRLCRLPSSLTLSSWLLAGAERIFHMIDEEPEVDDGYVTLVNARKNADGSLTECKERTGVMGLEASSSG